MTESKRKHRNMVSSTLGTVHQVVTHLTRCLNYLLVKNDVRQAW